MPGPPPKDPSVRARTNKTVTRAVLEKPARRSVRIPPLPRTIDWYPEVKAWWKDLWESEPRKEWIDVDIHLLYVAARLYQMMLDPETKVTAAKALAGEYRQILVQFGLTPMARRSLQWEVLRVEDAAAARKAAAKKAPAKKAAAKKAGPADPRARFRVVNGG
ncbi:phage terminase small subunit [Mycobacterium sp. C3-094]